MTEFDPMILQGDLRSYLEAFLITCKIDGLSTATALLFEGWFSQVWGTEMPTLQEFLYDRTQNGACQSG